MFCVQMSSELVVEKYGTDDNISNLLVYSNRPRTLQELQENIRGACAAIIPTVLRNVRKSYVNSIRMCRQQDGNQF
ncbi:hypothetical protein C0J52_05151 [Blattella germanica]|nr:hypothetical protein C0J52_05151 [Blattella germanica]